MYKTKEEIREKGASIIHDVWSYWQRYLHIKCKEADNDGNFISFESELFRRWEKQLNTNYNDLSEEEKESDRKIFDKFYADFIHQIRQDDINVIKEMIREDMPDYVNNSIMTVKQQILEKVLQNLDNLNT